MTVQQLITASLQDLRVIQTGETASADDSAFAMERLNDWINGLATENLTVYTITRTTWTLSTASSYTVGIGARYVCLAHDRIQPWACLNGRWIRRDRTKGTYLSLPTGLVLQPHI